MKSKDRYRRLPSFSFLIMMVMVGLLVLFIAILSALSFTETQAGLIHSSELARNTSQQHLSDSLHLVSRGLRLFELTYDKDLYQAFISFLSAYEESGAEPARINLETVRQSFPAGIANNTDLYIINSDGVVISTTYPQDRGLDFSQWPEVFSDITGIRLNDTFRSDRAVIGFTPEQIIRKFAYHPTPDHRYLLELSVKVDEYSAERAEFSVVSVGESIARRYPDIRSVALYDAMFRHHTGTGGPAPDENPDTDRYVREAFATRGTIDVEDPVNASLQRYTFVDLGGEETVSDNLLDIVARIDYDTSALTEAIRASFYYHLLIALVSVALGALLIVVVTQQLTRPIDQIIDDIGIISRGDLDHPVHRTGNPVFERLEQSMNLLVSSLKSSIRELEENEAQLTASELRYRSLIEDQTDLIVRSDSRGTILYANGEFCRYFSLQNPTGARLKDVVPAETARAFSEKIQYLDQDHRSHIFEHQVPSREGTFRWLLWSIKAIISQEGKMKECLAVGRDITGRKEIELALKESEEKLSTLISHLPDYVIVHQQSRVLFINAALTHGLGYSAEDLMGRSVFDFLLPEERTLVASYLERRESGEFISDYEIHVRAKDGTIRTVMVRASPIPFENNPAVLTVLTDITGQKDAELQVLEGEQRYQRLIEQLNEGIWITDEKMVTTFTNSRMQQLLGYENDELVGRSIITFVSLEQIDMLMDKWQNLRNGFVERFPVVFITRKGAKLYSELSATPSYNREGVFSGTLALVSDITVRKQNEEKIDEYTRELEHKNRELVSLRDQLFVINKNLDRIVHKRTEQVMNLLRQKDEFIMQLGHDLRTPLTPIIGLLPDLRENAVDEETCTALDIIGQNIRFINDIAHKSLKLARMNSFTLALEVEKVDIRTEVMGTIAVYEQHLARAGITPQVFIPHGLYVAADRVLFQELVENMITNAIKYIQRSDGILNFFGLSAGPEVIMRIEDNGIGLRADETERVFEEFYKSDRSRHDKSSTGLGLSICRRIVENHGGTIRAESPGPGEGTIFIISLPIWNEYESEPERSS